MPTLVQVDPRPFPTASIGHAGAIQTDDRAGGGAMCSSSRWWRIPVEARDSEGQTTVRLSRLHRHEFAGVDEHAARAGWHFLIALLVIAGILVRV
jgi:hypothetical protein